tara:strand:- start:46 stop:486 length:441 start_codon:yes stop_codon:yes gene_type:complete
MLKHLLIILLLLPLRAQAEGPDRVSILLGSRHYGADGFQEVNPGLFLTWERDMDISIGVFRNSYNKAAIAATVAVPVVEWDQGNISLFAGAAYYPEDGRLQKIHLGDVIPIGGIQARHKDIFFQLTPLDGDPVKGLLAFGVTWAID